MRTKIELLNSRVAFLQSQLERKGEIDYRAQENALMNEKLITELEESQQ